MKEMNIMIRADSKRNHMITLFRQMIMCLIISIPLLSYTQNKTSGDTVQALTLEACIDYAYEHQPNVNKAKILQEIAKTTNRINLSGWLPQINLTGNLIHYNTLPTSFLTNPVPGGEPIATKTGIVNTAIPELSFTETLFNPQLLYYAKNSKFIIKQAKQITDSVKINLVTAVSKSYYNLLQTLEQVKVLKEDTARLKRNIQDTYNQYIGGIVDETDYDEAVIEFNNSLAQLKLQTENIAASYAILKQAMGYPPEKDFNVAFDITKMKQEIAFDTTQVLQYEKRVEYQQLQTVRQLQHEQTIFYKYAFAPSLTAFYNYYDEYENNDFSKLFSNSYPYSYMGLSLNFPIFTGMSRLENVHRSKLEEKTLDWNEVNLKSIINTQYKTSLANYKSNLYNWQLLKKNEAKAKAVYDIVSLQYQQGTVAYLNLIVAESNLITAETGYINALFQLLSSKIDLEKALGIISYK